MCDFAWGLPGSGIRGQDQLQVVHLCTDSREQERGPGGEKQGRKEPRGRWAFIHPLPLPSARGFPGAAFRHFQVCEAEPFHGVPHCAVGEAPRDVGQLRQGAVGLYLPEAGGRSKSGNASWAEEV